jgi:predicted nucleic acid-binding protein
MSQTNLRCVLDASVGIKLFIEEEYSNKVHRLFAILVEDPQTEFCVPDLFYVECASILLKYIRRYKRPFKDSIADLRNLNELALRSTRTSELIEEAVVLAYKNNLTAYDACYAVLAQKLGVPLLTADSALVKALPWAVWI